MPSYVHTYRKPANANIAHKQNTKNCLESVVEIDDGETPMCILML